MHDDFERCYRAVHSRDTRFDGWFFTAVTSTRIYCRPSCPARTPKRENVRFYASAAAAQQAGFRACLRCRPDASPGSPEWLGRSDVAARAMKLIFDGTVERTGVSGLARSLGYSERQLHRVLLAEVGTGALALARAQRAQTARTLLQTTDIPITQVAFGAGFASVRQFNETVQAIFARTPTELRLRARPAAAEQGAIALRLPCRPPFAVTKLLTFLGQRTISGLESASAGSYSRTLRLHHGHATVAISGKDDASELAAVFTLDDLRDLTSAIARCRHLLNLDADPLAVDGVLATDPLLRKLVDRTPGLRVPGTVDGFELATRAVIGQQVSVAGAQTVTSAILRNAAAPINQPTATLTHVFPSPRQLLTLTTERPAAFAMPGARRRTLAALARALLDEDLQIGPGADPHELRARLLAIPGIGPWTADYISMRALGDPDAYLPTDLGVRRALSALGETDPIKRAERWRPWRAYAVAHLWSLPITAKQASKK